MQVPLEVLQHVGNRPPVFTVAPPVRGSSTDPIIVDARPVEPPAQPGMSTGVKIALGVGATVAAVGLGWWLWGPQPEPVAGEAVRRVA